MRSCRGIPAAKTYDGPLTERAAGGKFEIPVAPTPNFRSGQVNLTRRIPEVKDVGEDTVAIPVEVEKNTQG